MLESPELKIFGRVFPGGSLRLQVAGRERISWDCRDLPFPLKDMATFWQGCCWESFFDRASQGAHCRELQGVVAKCCRVLCFI